MLFEKHLFIFLMGSLLVLVLSCESKPNIYPDYKRAEATLISAEGSSVQGIVTFTEVEGGVRIVAVVEGLLPGKHGFHIHEVGNCSRMEQRSYGNHFNPDNQHHGGPNDSPRHAGDLGNITANLRGRAHYDAVDRLITLDGPESIVGRSIVIHKYPDDFISQPSGNSGPAVACGLIEPKE